MLNKILVYIRKFLGFSNDYYFLGSTDALPAPLKLKEEIELVKKKEEGDINAKEKLIEHNIRLVVYLAKRYENTNIDLEDLVSIGSIGLIKGINTYKLEKNIKLATYVSRCIDNEILMYLRKTKRKKTEISFEDSLSYDSEGNELHLEDVLGTDEDIVTKPIEEVENRNELIRELNKLDERDKQIMVLRYGLNGYKEMTQKEVAEFLNISQSYISRIEKKIIKNIKQIVKC